MRMLWWGVAITKNIGDLLEVIRGLPIPERLKLVERVVHDIASGENPSPSKTPMSVIGSFSDIPDVMQDVCEAAMVARQAEHRERDALCHPFRT